MGYVVLAVFGLLLIGPIWLLWLAGTKQTSVAVSLGLLTVFIILFGWIMQSMTRASTEQVFGATAAYAAVLVVFVGTSGGSNSDQRAAAINATATTTVTTMVTATAVRLMS